MTKRRIILTACALLLFAVFIVPNLITRMSFEQSSKIYVPAIDLTRVAKYFEDEELPQIVEKYKAAGASTAIIHEDRGVYSEDYLALARTTGLNIAIIPDANWEGDGHIERIVKEYNVKYIVLQIGTLVSNLPSMEKSKPICQIIDKYDLTLVIVESFMQLGNEEPLNFHNYIDAADGKVIRSYRTNYTTNVEQMDYPAIYYQAYISASDRNTRFLHIKQLNDKGFTAHENAERTMENLRLTCEKLESDGFVKDGSVDYRTYSEYEDKLTLISAASAAIAVLMLALALDLLLRLGRGFTIIGLCAVACAFVATFVLPQTIVALYPTLLAAFAPCFGVTVAALYVHKLKGRQKTAPLIICTIAISIAVMIAFASVVSALLGGSEYFLNLRVFRGVKLSLIAPMVTAFLLLAASLYKKHTLKEYRAIVSGTLEKTRWYHLLLLALVAGAATIYVVRSGNVNTISFLETNIRNTLTEIFTARPRTKEILFGWPCFVLYIYFAKKNASPLLRIITAIGASTLFASIINTFCHVFTMVETMYMRVAVGMLFGIPVSLIALGAWMILEKIYTKLTTKKAQ